MKKTQLAKISVLMMIALAIIGCKSKSKSNRNQEGDSGRVPEVEVPQSKGLLPKDFEWAYGWWKVTEDAPLTGLSSYIIILNSDTYQTDIVKLRYEDEDFYPVYTMPKFEYSIVEDEGIKSNYNFGGDVLGLATSNPNDDYIVIDNSKKIVYFRSHWRLESVKIDAESNPTIIAEYNNKLSSIPIDGRWKSTRVSRFDNEYAYLEIEKSDKNILTKSGHIIEHNNGLVSIDTDRELLTVEQWEESDEMTFKRIQDIPSEHSSESEVSSSYSNSIASNSNSNSSSFTSRKRVSASFDSALDVLNYISEHKFKDFEENLVMTFNSTPEMYVDNTCLTGALRITDFNSSRAYLSGTFVTGEQCRILVDCKSGEIHSLLGARETYYLIE